MIYVARDKTDGLIKIGSTECLRLRIIGLRSTFPGADLEILAIQEGALPNERALHRRFAAHAVIKMSRKGPAKEWYTPSREILGFVRDECRVWMGENELVSPKLEAKRDWYTKQAGKDAKRFSSFFALRRFVNLKRLGVRS